MSRRFGWDRGRRISGLHPVRLGWDRYRQNVLAVASLTCNLSLVDGTAFISNPSVDLTPYLGWTITLNDGTQNLVGWIKAAGTGETTNVVYTSDFTVGVDGWTTSGTVVAGNIDSIGGENDWLRVYAGATTGLHRAQKNYTGVAGTLYSAASRYYLPTNTNVDGWKFTSTSNDGLGSPVYNTKNTATNVTFRYTALGTVLSYTQTKAGDTSFTGENLVTDDLLYLKNVVISQIITPSATGVAIWDLTDDNWVSDGGINKNATSYKALLSAL